MIVFGAGNPLRATVESSAVVVLGTLIAAVILPSAGPVEIFRAAAIVMALALLIATGLEASSGVGNLIRVDLLMIWALYGLTFFEFLFPQPDVETLLTSAAALTGTYAVLLGFAGLAIGRHLVPRRYVHRGFSIQMEPNYVFVIFVILTIVGYLHMLVGVNFDFIEMLRQMALPRFEVAWARGRYGGAYSLLYELGMLIYLIPPIAGLVYARARDFGGFQKTVITLVLMLTFYYGFASGTRNVFATYIIAFIGTYVLVKPNMTLGRSLVVGLPMMLLLFVGAKYMLEFRTVGLANYSFQSPEHYDTVFIDHNMVNLSQLTEVFPDTVEYLGFEVPIAAIIRPIPRVLWPDKPEGLSTSIESVLGAGESMSLSCTFVGEAYMAGGFLAVCLFSLFFGASAELWNRIGRDVSSPFSRLLYASGFLCAAIGMRSMLSMVPLMLPTFALWLCLRLWQPSRSAAARRL